MPSQFRIPKARIDGAYGAVMTRVAKRMWGEVPDNAHVLWHNKPVMRAVFGFEQKVGEVEGARPAPQDVRRDGERRGDRLLVVPGLRLLPGPHQGPRRGQGPRGAALAASRTSSPSSSAT